MIHGVGQSGHKLFAVPYFSVRSSRSAALHYGLPLHKCQNYLGGGGSLGGSEKNRGTVITSLQLAFRRCDRNITPFTIHSLRNSAGDEKHGIHI